MQVPKAPSGRLGSGPRDPELALVPVSLLRGLTRAVESSVFGRSAMARHECHQEEAGKPGWHWSQPRACGGGPVVVGFRVARGRRAKGQTAHWSSSPQGGSGGPVAPGTFRRMGVLGAR